MSRRSTNRLINCCSFLSCKSQLQLYTLMKKVAMCKHWKLFAYLMLFTFPRSFNRISSFSLGIQISEGVVTNLFLQSKGHARKGKLMGTCSEDPLFV